MTDFFMSGKDMLWQWCLRKKEFNSIDISRYGYENYYICANRMIRKFTEQGKLRRLTKEEKLMRGDNSMIAYYTIKEER